MGSHEGNITVGTLHSELGPHVDSLVGRPRIYADANVPTGLVGFMRGTLGWDVLFVLEHDDLRRAHDREHYRLSRQLRRTLITLDRDYCDDRRFPPEESGGVIIVSAPDERSLAELVTRIDEKIFRSEIAASADGARPPLAGRKLQTDINWPRAGHLA